MGLHLDLARFDGKGVAVLEEIKANTSPGQGVLETLIDIVGDDDKDMQTGASWLLRAYLADGSELASSQVGRLASNLLDMHDGFGRLHLCQAMDHIVVPRAHADVFADFFRSCQGTKNTFLRAWAPHGFFQLAQQFEEYRAEAMALVERALSDPAPSVRARARKTLAGE